MTETPTPPNAPDDGELVAADDAVIGRAIKGSLIALAIIVVGVVGFFLWQGREPEREQVDEKEIVLPKVQERVATPPAVTFSNITRTAGITFEHVNGATGEKLLPETMGGGCAFFDYDGDGDQDLLFVNGRPWTGSNGAGASTAELYRNDGAGNFENVTAGSGLDVSCYGMGIAVGDFDNDGDGDVFIAAVGSNHLFRNDGGRFTDVTAEAGVAGRAREWSSSSGFFDYDNDGLLDLMVCNYVRWTAKIDTDLGFSLVGVGRAYGPPTNFEGSFPYLYRNLGGGKFEDVSESAGLHVENAATGIPVAKALGIAPFDYDRDGNIDVIMANDTVQNFLFHNVGGKFEEIGSLSGVAYDSNGKSTGAMGIDAAYYRNDDSLAVGIGNFANEMTSLYVAPDDSGYFTDEAITEGIGPATRLQLSFGLFFFDYDNDGNLDLLQANGHLEDEINIVQPSQEYRQSAQLFWNSGDASGRCFVTVNAETTGDFAEPIVGRGAAYADIDGDGDLDVLLTQIGGPPLLLRNDQALGHHWLRVKLVGKTANRDGIGAWVECEVGGRTLRRQVMPTRSYQSQVELPVTFGLGTHERVDALRVRWPGGAVQDVAVDGVDRTLTVTQPQS